MKSPSPLLHISAEANVAAQFGLDEAVFLDSVLFWWRTNRDNGRNLHDGRTWTYNSVKTYSARFSWWTEKQLRRVITSCIEKGALLVANYNEDARDRTIWYSPSDALLALYGESETIAVNAETNTETTEPSVSSASQTGNCICPNGKMQSPKRANSSAQMGEPLPCYYHVTTNNPPDSPPAGDGANRKSVAKYHPDWFDRFYDCYPLHKGRKSAVRAWDKLKPDEALLAEILAALAVAVTSPEWTKDNGRYIPHPASWLNGRRWEDEATRKPQPLENQKHIAPLRGKGVRYL